MEALEIDIDVEERPVKVKRKDGTEKNYVLRELTGRQRGQYLNGMNSRLQVSQDGKVTGIKDFIGMEASLLNKCLYNDENKLVTDNELQELPARVLRKLFEAAQVLSGLNTDSAKEVKND